MGKPRNVFRDKIRKAVLKNRDREYAAHKWSQELQQALGLNPADISVATQNDVSWRIWVPPSWHIWVPPIQAHDVTCDAVLIQAINAKFTCGWENILVSTDRTGTRPPDPPSKSLQERTLAAIRKERGTT